MKLNIANPATGAQKKIEIDDENRLQLFMDRRLAQEVPGDALGDEFKGYVFKITGGNDSEGFPMRQGVLVAKRVKLLLRRGITNIIIPQSQCQGYPDSMPSHFRPSLLSKSLFCFDAKECRVSGRSVKERKRERRCGDALSDPISLRYH